MTSIADLEVTFKNSDANKDGLLSVQELAVSTSLSVTQAESLMDYFAAGDEMTFSEYIVMSKVLKSDVSGVFKVSIFIVYSLPKVKARRRLSAGCRV